MSSAREFLDAFVVETKHHTGGGCMAWRLEMPRGWYVLVTDLDGASEPADDDEAVMVGLHDPDGDEHEVRDPVSWALAIAIVRDWIAVVPQLARMRQNFDETVREGAENVAEMRERIDRASGNMDELKALKLAWVGHSDVLPDSTAADVEAFLREWLEVVQQ